MSESSKRSLQVSDLIRRELSAILMRETSDLRLTKLSIIEVDVSRDLRCARIYYSLLDADQALEGTQKALDKGTGFLRRRIAERVSLRYIPRFEFIYDKTLEKAQRMNELLKDVNHEETESPPED